MTDASLRHPEVQTMAAFLDGTLAPDEIPAVADHLRECPDCRTVVTETARFVREEEEARPSAAPTPWRWWMAAAAAALLAVVALPLLRRQTSPIEQLIATAPREHRLVEARLSGFPWARLQAPSRGGAPPDPADLKLAGAAGDVLEKTRDERVADALHARGVAYLLIDRQSESITALEEAAGNGGDKRVWNDLAAARYGASEDHPSQLPHALAAVDRALKLDPNFSEAVFNRALILERMQLRDPARSAWRRYLELDSGSEWGVEARQHLQRLERTSARFDPKSLASVPAETIVRQFPQEARTWGEGPLLGEWADAEAAHADEKFSDAKLSIVRALGKALAAFNGERLLEDAVAAIDRSNGEGRAALAGAHRLYRDARIAYSRHHAETAEQPFRQAATIFRNHGSPMAEVAEYYAANAAFEQNRGAEARQELLALLEKVERQAGTSSASRKALAAQIHWTLALLANIAGDWGTGVREAEAASELFRSLGERQNAAFVDTISAYTLERIGDSDLAWRRRLQAMEVMCGTGEPDRCNSLLQDAATTLASTDRAEAAAALIGVTTLHERTSDPALLASALTQRARVERQSGNGNEARRSLAAAMDAAARMKDKELRAIAETQIAIEEASLQGDPRVALMKLDRAVAFAGRRRLLHLLPRIHLERARALRSTSDTDAARGAYESALSEIAAQQSSINDPSLRLAFLDTAREAVEETIVLELARGKVAAALAMADWRQGGSGASTAVPRHVAVVEYVVLPRKVIIFTASHAGIDVATSTVDRNELVARIATLDEKIRRRAPVAEIRAVAAALFVELIAPVRAKIAPFETLVFVPDRQLYAVPFAALYDERNAQHLIEEFTIRIARSSSAAASEATGALSPALVIADPPTAKWRRLAASREEAQRVAAIYGATLLSGEAATRARFTDAAAQSALIHFSGHADSDARESWGALLLAAGDGDSGIVGTSDLARLQLAAHPLVVLAACGTFRGDPVHLSGMSSLARAFLIAGARGVVGTLWEIEDDVAGPLFLRFHQSLRAGASPARALRDAQLQMLHSADPRLSHPATWSAMALSS